MIILGLNAFHADSSAALVRDGVLVAAAEEERFRRIKHWAGFPSEAIAYCLREAGLQLGDVDHIAVNQDNRANFARKIGLSHHQSARNGSGARASQKSSRSAREFLSCLAKAFPGQNFRARSTTSNITSPIFRPPFTCLPSRRPSSSRLTASVTSQVRLGVWEAGAICR